MKQAAKKLDGRGTVAMINVDKNPGGGREFGVRAIPFLAIVQNGKIVGQNFRPRSEDDIVEEYQKFL